MWGSRTALPLSSQYKGAAFHPARSGDPAQQLLACGKTSVRRQRATSEGHDPIPKRSLRPNNGHPERTPSGQSIRPVPIAHGQASHRQLGSNGYDYSDFRPRGLERVQPAPCRPARLQPDYPRLERISFEQARARVYRRDLLGTLQTKRSRPNSSVKAQLGQRQVSNTITCLPPNALRIGRTIYSRIIPYDHCALSDPPICNKAV